MKIIPKTQINSNKDFSVLLMRIGIGIVFIVHGWLKMEDLNQTIKLFSSFGLDSIYVYLVITLEIVGGLLLLLGFFVRIISLIFAVIMFTAIFTIKSHFGFTGGYELEFLLLVFSFSLALHPEDKYSLQNILSKK